MAYYRQQSCQNYVCECMCCSHMAYNDILQACITNTPFHANSTVSAYVDNSSPTLLLPSTNNNNNNNNSISAAQFQEQVPCNMAQTIAKYEIDQEFDEVDDCAKYGPGAVNNNVAPRKRQKITSRVLQRRLPSAGKKLAMWAGISAPDCHFIPNNSSTSKLAAEPATAAGFVHVRARPGQATNSHSLAERARRNKISERMKILEDLVPGCRHKIPNMTMVLDEIINYVQTLQQQVQLMCAKLATISPCMDLDADDLMVGKHDSSN